MTELTPALNPPRDRDVEAFLAVLSSRRAPRTVEAYRRDLTELSRALQAPIAEATIDDLERYTASLRDAGL